MQFYNQEHAGAQNDIVIDVTDANDVARFVDHFFTDHGLSSQASRARIHNLLKYLPAGLTHQKEITSWIRKNWDRKFYR